MSESHCTTVDNLRAECTCGWRSPSSFYDAERLAAWHCLAVDETIDNPYLRAFLAPVTDDEIAALGFNDEFATSFDMRERLTKHMRRDRLVAQYAWAIPTELVIRRLAELSPICDLGCGTGYWAKLLVEAGARVLAVDKDPPLTGDNHWHRSPAGLSKQEIDLWHFVDVVPGEATTFDVPVDHTLMLCWPPYASDMAACALARYRGDRVIYVGESDGCTGDDAFHKMLDDAWELTAYYDIPQWDGIHDSVYVYVRKSCDEPRSADA